MRRRLALWLGTGTTLLVLAALLLTRSTPAPAAPQATGFAGKTVLVVTREVDRSVTLAQPELRDLGGRSFLVGREAKESRLTKVMYGEGTVWIPVDTIVQLVELQ